MAVVGAPIAVSAAALPAARGNPSPPHTHVHLIRTPVVSADKLATLAHRSLQRLHDQPAAAAAAGVGGLIWLPLATPTGRPRRVLRRAGRGRRTRAPPEGSASVVPFGPASGPAG